jgi:hypothetical protein
MVAVGAAAGTIFQYFARVPERRHGRAASLFVPAGYNKKTTCQ